MATGARRTWPPELRGLGARIEQARLRRGMSQRALARKVGLQGAGGISRVENGTRLIPLTTLFKVAKELLVPIPWLITGEGELPPAVPCDPEDADRRRRPDDVSDPGQA